jgi:zinc protease
MFNQTANHPPGDFDRLLETAGGDTNAATWVDWTYYRNNLPKAELQLAVELEADRMAHLTLGETQVESEREVVANERRFRVEDDVDGFLNEELYKMAFTVHPYHWPTIGWMRDIEAISIDDCRTFYRTYYAPNNATVVLCGDVDEDAALALIESHYGKIPAAQLPPDRAQAEPAQTAERRQVWQKQVTADKLRIGYKGPAIGNPDYAALEVVSEILFGGNSSRLHRRLVVDTEIASSSHAASAPFRDPGLYEISVGLQRGHSSAEAEAIIYKELEHLGSQQLESHELDTAKTRLLTHFWRELRPQAGKAEALGHYETTVGDYRKLFGVADGYRAVTADDVARIVRTYLVPERRTVVIAAPQKGRGVQQ